MGIEGQLTIILHTRGGRVDAVDVSSTRPLHAPRIFVGRSPSNLLETVPMIYSLCATAQAAAARQACAAALGVEPDAAGEAGRLLVDLETVREHTVGILLGWAESLGEGPGRAAPRMVQLLPAVRQALFPDGRAFALDARLDIHRESLAVALDEMRDVLESEVFGMALADWHGLASEADLEAWARRTSTVAARVVAQALREEDGARDREEVALLPALDADFLRERLRAADADAFIAHPHWQGLPGETSSLSRQHAHSLVAAMRRGRGNALVTRLVARLAELAALALRLQRELPRLDDAAGTAVSADASATGEGLSQVEAARGRLVHRVELAGGLVSRYQVLAPTEWNFHPQGAAVASLLGLPAGDHDRLRRRAALAIRAMDPCVGFELVVSGH